jgi:ribulose-5-phosphate 4-epimerase/fuculose-1-phosphate aldolase
LNLNHTINQLIKAAGYAGADVTLVQGGGGNVSVKSPDGSSMFIKASGFTLSEITEKDGYVEIDRLKALKALKNVSLNGKTRSRVQDEFSALINKTTKAPGLRPSIEAGFHAVLPSVVIHTHPVYINAFLCMKDGAERFLSMTGHTFSTVGYYPPGYELASAVAKEYVETGSSSGGILLANHGFVTYGGTADEAISIMDDAEKTARRLLGELEIVNVKPPGSLLELAENIAIMGNYPVVKTQSCKFIQETAFNDKLAQSVVNPLVPDDVVYNYGRIFISGDKKILSLPEKFILIVKGEGVIIGAPSARTVRNMEETLTAHIMMRKLINGKGKPVELPQEEIDFLMGIESEKFRSSMM